MAIKRKRKRKVSFLAFNLFFDILRWMCFDFFLERLRTRFLSNALSFNQRAKFEILELRMLLERQCVVVVDVDSSRTAAEGRTGNAGSSPEIHSKEQEV